MNSEHPEITNENDLLTTEPTSKDRRGVREVTDGVKTLVKETAGTGDDEKTAPAEAGETLVKKSRVFIVDDDKMILMLLCRAFEMKGFTDVTPFEDGEDVLDFILGDDGVAGEVLPDLIISDTQMKRMDGPEMWKELKAALPEKLLPEMLATSGGLGQEERWDEDARFIPKPYDFRELRDTVTRLLKARIEKKD